MMIQRYVSKISGPLLDRIDIHIDVPSVNYRELRSGATPESSADIRKRVIHARDVQLQRGSIPAASGFLCECPDGIALRSRQIL